MIKKILLVLMLLLISTTALADTQLRMMHNQYCPYCINFLSEVRDEYIRSEYNTFLPLVIMNLRIKKTHEWIKAHQYLTPIRGTPTFIIWDDEKEREIDRIVGYANKVWFYERLNKIIKKYGLKDGKKI